MYLESVLMSENKNVSKQTRHQHPTGSKHELDDKRTLWQGTHISGAACPEGASRRDRENTEKSSA